MVKLTIRASASLTAAAALLMLTGCHRTADLEAARKAIAANEASWNRQLDSRNLDGLVSHFAPDATIVEPGAKEQSGTAAIRKSYGAVLKDPNFHVRSDTENTVVAASTDLAYSRGHYTAKYTDPTTGQIRSGSGSFLTIYRRQPDGSWKWAEDFASADPAPE